MSALPEPNPTTELLTDTHLHLWDRSGGGYGWLEGAPPALRRNARWEDVAPQLAARHVTRVVLVQADDTLEDTRFLEQTAQDIEAAAGPVARADMVAWLPLARPRQLRQTLEEEQLDHLVGVRHLIHDDPDAGFLDRPGVRESLGVLADRGLPLDVPDAFPRHLLQAAGLAEEAPELVIVLDHLGKPPLGDVEAMSRWETQLRAFAAHPRTVAKVSGLSTSGRGADPAALRQVLHVALEAFGPSRLLYGSDWPIAPVPFDHRSGADPLLVALGELGRSERAEIFRGTAERVYRRIGAAAEG